MPSEGHHREKADPPNIRDGLASRCGPAVQLVKRLKGRNRTEARNFSGDPQGELQQYIHILWVDYKATQLQAS